MNDDQLFLFEAEPAAKPEKVPHEWIVQVFEFWKATLRTSSKGPSPVLSEKRVTAIRKALKAYGLEACFQAIQGCAVSDWHMGKNPQGRRYDDLELIFRDARKTEMFIQYYHEAKDGGGFLDEE